MVFCNLYSTTKTITTCKLPLYDEWKMMIDNVYTAGYEGDV